MFNEEFYPTPEWLVNKMLEGVDLGMVRSILEPSAGKGDIVDKIKGKYERLYYNRYDKLDIDTIEYDKNLQHILKGKNYRVVYNDYLTFHTYKKYDLIIMNPPFSNGDKHLLKALEMQKDGGNIICLLNAETIKNPYSNERKTLVNKLEELNANIEYIENAFVNAEHKTGVEVALIKVFIPEKEKVSYIFEELRQQETYNEVEQKSEYQLISDDFIEEIVNQYNLEIQAGIKLINEYIAMSPYILQDLKKTEYKSDPILKLCITGDSQYSNSLSINNFIKKVRIKYWSALFNNPKFTEKMTSNLISEYHSRINELQEYDFSIYNIYQIKIEMSKNLISGVEDTLIKLFDELSNQHSYYDTSKNIHYYNGWKTNKAWYINKKVIMPYMNAFSTWDNRFDPDYRVKQKLNDIERTLNYLDGNRTMNIDLYERLEKAKFIGQTSKIELKYFKVTFYKKGTCHLEFTNEELLKKFNIYGSQKKGWLPPSYGKKTYEEMNKEEQAVIDDFEGKENYEKTLSKIDYYITNSNELLQLN